MSMTRQEVAGLIDHTLLKPEATPADVAALIAEARELGTYSVCVSPSMIPLPDPTTLGNLKLAVVCGFPSGKHVSSIKAAEAGRAVGDGAHEVDMVIDIGALLSGDDQYVHDEIAAVKVACEGAVLKVIIESAALPDDLIIAACRAAEAAGADFVKTSTGYHPSGGASTHAVELMRASVSDRLGVKASGGIRDAATALAMISAGANRLGLSASRDVLAGLPE